MPNPRRIAEKLAKESTRLIGARWGESFPFYYVAEHPKSGGTWLAQMVSDYLVLPFPRYSVLPITFSSVIQNHWRYQPRLKRVFYIYRDGRDVMTSFYFDRIRVARYAQRPASAHLNRTYERLFGRNYDPQDVVTHLPRFIEFEFENPGRGTPLHWRDHVIDWVQPGRPDIAYLSYEQLRQDCAGTLSRVLGRLLDQEPDPWRIETTVEKMSMQRQTGRKPGKSDLSQHIRKGVVGDWKNHFSREAAEIFDHLAGDALVHLQYEKDRSWVDRYNYPTP